MGGDISIFNDLDQMYSQPILSAPNGDLMCPVCQRTYVTKDRLITHLDKRSCHSYRALFHRTTVECEFYTIYTELCILGNSPPNSMARFRRSGLYTSIAKTYVFCLHNKIKLKEYIEWVVNTGSENYSKSISYAADKQSKLHEFMTYQRRHRRDDECERFYNLHKSKFTDVNWVLRAIERGDISLKFFESHIDMDSFVDSLNHIQIERFRSLINVVN